MAYTNDSRYFTEPTTSLNILILTDPGSFRTWEHDLRIVAEGKDLWRLIGPDHERILRQPTRPSKPRPPKVDDYINLVGEYSRPWKDRFDYASRVYQNDAVEYNLDLAAYDRQQERLREARMLLLATVSPEIRAYASYKVFPHKVMAKIKAFCDRSRYETQRYCH